MRAPKQAAKAASAPSGYSGTTHLTLKCAVMVPHPLIVAYVVGLVGSSNVIDPHAVHPVNFMPDEGYAVIAIWSP